MPARARTLPAGVDVIRAGFARIDLAAGAHYLL